MVPNPNFDVPILMDRIPLDSGRFISFDFPTFELATPLEPSYLVYKRAEFKIGT